MELQTFNSLQVNHKPVVYFCDERNGIKGVTEEELVEITGMFKVVFPSDLRKDCSLSHDVQGIVTSTKAYAIANARKWIPHMPHLKAIVCLSAGYDHFEREFKEFGIPFANCPNVYTKEVADIAMTLLLSSGCGLLSMMSVTMFADKPGYLPLNHRSPGVSGSTLGIFGMGSIGSAIARRAQGFQMQIFYFNRNRKTLKEEMILDATYIPSLDEMLPYCDYIMVTCSLNESTRHAFGTKQFQLMKSSAIFINVSRGQVVDQDALVSALESGEIYGAALDVTDPEPLPPGHPLLKMENVIITPHMSHYTKGGLHQCLDIAKRNLEAAILYDIKMPNEIEQ